MANTRGKPGDSKGEVSVLKRVGAILNLLTEESPSLTLDGVVSALGVSAPTAYRYLADLCEMGLLHRMSGVYTPGPKILELDYLSRKFDPVLNVSGATMIDLCGITKCHVVLARLYGHASVNVFYAKSAALPDIPFIPGRRLPIFQGSPSRVLLAHLDRRQQRRIFDAYANNPWRDRIGSTWEKFASANAEVRRMGYYVSREELAPNITGVAAPVLDESGEPFGALALTFASATPPAMGEKMIIQLAKQYAQYIAEQIIESARHLQQKP